MKIMIQVLKVKKTTFSTQFVDKAAGPSRLCVRSKFLGGKGWWMGRGVAVKGA